MNPPDPDDAPRRDDAAVEQAAADWIARLDRGLTPEESVAFAAWEAADSRHVAELARLQATWRALDTADESPEIMQIAHELSGTALPTDTPGRNARLVMTFGMAAALLIGVFVWRAVERPGTGARHHSYRVVPSEAQQLTLIDGTVVQVKAGSAVEPAFSASERRVRLVQGEAYFTVAHDPARSFVVMVGDVAVRAVGTAFNVRLEAVSMEVLVTEGKVRIDDSVRGRNILDNASAAPQPHREATDAAVEQHVPASEAPTPVLGAGQRVVIDTQTCAPIARETAKPADLERMRTWQSTQFVFDHTPLGDAVAAFNSFNRIQVVLGEPSLATRRLGGTFRADNIDAFVRLLETGFEITAERHGETEIVLRPTR